MKEVLRLASSDIRKQIGLVSAFCCAHDKSSLAMSALMP